MTAKVHWGLGADEAVPQNKITQGLAYLMMQQSLLTIVFDLLMNNLSKQIDKSATNLNNDTKLEQKANTWTNISNSMLIFSTIVSTVMMGGSFSLYSIEEEQNLSVLRKGINSIVNRGKNGLKMHMYSVVVMDILRAACKVIQGNFQSKTITQKADTDNLKNMLEITTTSNNKISTVSQAIATAIKDAIENNYRAEKVNINKIQ